MLQLVLCLPSRVFMLASQPEEFPCLEHGFPNLFVPMPTLDMQFDHDHVCVLTETQAGTSHTHASLRTDTWSRFRSGTTQHPVTCSTLSCCLFSHIHEDMLVSAHYWIL